MKTWTFFLFSLGSLLGAIASFIIGIIILGNRVEAMCTKKEATGSETVYLGDVLHANRAAESGYLIALVFLLAFLVFLWKGIAQCRRNRKALTVGESPEND